MHRTAFAGTEWRTRTGNEGSAGRTRRTGSASRTGRLTRTGTLEDRLPAYRQSSAIAHRRRRHRLGDARRGRRRSSVHRTRSGLRHNHAARRRLAGQRRPGSGSGLRLVGRGGRIHWRSRRRRGGRCFDNRRFRNRNCGSGSFDHRDCTRRGLDCLGCRRRDRSRNFRRRMLDHRPGSHRLGDRRGSRYRRRGRDHCGRRPRRFEAMARLDRLRRDQPRSDRRSGSNRRPRSGRLIDNRLGRSRRWRHRGRRFPGLILARQNGLQRIAGLGDLGEIDFGAELVAAATTATAVAVAGAAGLTEILADLLGLIDLHGAGVGLFLRDADLDKHVENLFAFHFQLASQIVNSNLHPPLLSLMPEPSSPARNGAAAPERCTALPERSSLRKTSVLRLPGHASRRPRIGFPPRDPRRPAVEAVKARPEGRAAGGYLFAGSASASPG